MGNTPVTVPIIPLNDEMKDAIILASDYELIILAPKTQVYDINKLRECLSTKYPFSRSCSFSLAPKICAMRTGYGVIGKIKYDTDPHRS